MCQFRHGNNVPREKSTRPNNAKRPKLTPIRAGVIRANMVSKMEIDMQHNFQKQRKII